MLYTKDDELYFLWPHGCLRAGPPSRGAQLLPSLICGPDFAGAGSGHLYEVKGPPLRTVKSWHELRLDCLALPLHHSPQCLPEPVLVWLPLILRQENTGLLQSSWEPGIWLQGVLTAI